MKQATPLIVAHNVLADFRSTDEIVILVGLTAVRDESQFHWVNDCRPLEEMYSLCLQRTSSS
jgi:hypothetical protein